MEKGIVNVDSLEKDIVNIDFYASEEKIVLNKIYLKMEECLNNYKSSNRALIIKSINNYGGDIKKIYNKRIEYTKVLRKVIEGYIAQSNITKSMFDNFNF